MCVGISHTEHFPRYYRILGDVLQRIRRYLDKAELRRREREHGS